jgi:hypothetical protein
VSDLVEVVSVTLRAVAAGPGSRELDADVFVCHEPFDAAQLALEGGWRDVRQGYILFMLGKIGSPRTAHLMVVALAIPLDWLPPDTYGHGVPTDSREAAVRVCSPEHGSHRRT